MQKETRRHALAAARDSQMLSSRHEIHRLIYYLRAGKEVKQSAQAIITMELEKFVKVNAQLAGRGSIATFTLRLDDDNFMKTETELFIDNADILLVSSPESSSQ